MNKSYAAPLFERQIEGELLPCCKATGIATLTYGALCRGLPSGKLKEDAAFAGDDLRRIDPKFRSPRFARYLAAVRRLDEFAQRHYGKRVIHLTVRWLLDQSATAALWGARHPRSIGADRRGLRVVARDAPAKADIDRILRTEISDPVGPKFMAPPLRSLAEASQAAE